MVLFLRSKNRFCYIPENESEQPVLGRNMSDFGSFLTILRIQTLVLFLVGTVWLHGLLFYDWEMYDMLWCSQYCVTIPMGVHIGGKLTFPSNISSLIKGWSERSIFNVGRVKIFVQSIIPEPGDQTLTNSLLCSSTFADEDYLSLFVCRSHHFIAALMFM